MWSGGVGECHICRWLPGNVSESGHRAEGGGEVQEDSSSYLGQVYDMETYGIVLYS